MSQNYLVLVFFTFCYIIIDVGLQMVNAEVMLHMRQQREKMRRSKNRQRAADNTLEKTVYSNVATDGFAFSQAPGQDRLVIDNLSNRLKTALADKLFAGNLMMDSD